MSADNYYRVCSHPTGGYAVVMGFMSDDYDPEPTRYSPKYNTLEAAIAYAQSEYAEYGYVVDYKLDDESR